MRSSSTERGLSEVLGAILMFALVFSLLVIVQVWAVPTANAQVELEHSQALESDFGELSETLDRAVALGGSETSNLDAGLRYPSRIFLINPPPASYTITSSDVSSGGVSIANVEAIDGEANDFFTSRTPSGTLAYDTQSYTLDVTYNQYQQAPEYRIEGGILYKRFPNNEMSFIDTGSIVNGRTITLVSLEGDVGTGGTGPLSIPVEAMSGPMQTVSVTSDDDALPIRITLPTELRQEDWDALLAEQITNGFVDLVDVDEAAGTVDIELQPGETYDLRLSKVSLGREGVSTLDAAYITTAGSETDRRVTGASDFSVQVRDEFNNPVSGVEVTFSASLGEFRGGETTTIVTSDENGQASVRYIPDDQDATIVATIHGAGAPEPNPKRVNFNVDFVGPDDGDGNDGTNSINPHSGNVILVDVSETTDGDGLVLTFANEAGELKTLTDVRTNFFYQAAPGGSGGDSAVTARISYDSYVSDEMVIGGGLIGIQESERKTFSTVGTTDVTVRFYTDSDGDTPYGPPNADEFFVISFLFAEGRTSATYFVQGVSSLATESNAFEALTVDLDVTGNSADEATVTFTPDTDFAITTIDVAVTQGGTTINPGPFSDPASPITVTLPGLNVQQEADAVTVTVTATGSGGTETCSAVLYKADTTDDLTDGVTCTAS